MKLKIYNTENSQKVRIGDSTIRIEPNNGLISMSTELSKLMGITINDRVEMANDEENNQTWFIFKSTSKASFKIRYSNSKQTKSYGFNSSFLAKTFFRITKLKPASTSFKVSPEPIIDNKIKLFKILINTAKVNQTEVEKTVEQIKHKREHYTLP